MDTPTSARRSSLRPPTPQDIYSSAKREVALGESASAGRLSARSDRSDKSPSTRERRSSLSKLAPIRRMSSGGSDLSRVDKHPTGGRFTAVERVCVCCYFFVTIHMFIPCRTTNEVTAAISATPRAAVPNRQRHTRNTRHKQRRRWRWRWRWRHRASTKLCSQRCASCAASAGHATRCQASGPLQRRRCKGHTQTPWVFQPVLQRQC